MKTCFSQKLILLDFEFWNFLLYIWILPIFSYISYCASTPFLYTLHPSQVMLWGLKGAMSGYLVLSPLWLLIESSASPSNRSPPSRPPSNREPIVLLSSQTDHGWLHFRLKGNIISLFLHCVFLNRRKIVVKRNTMWKYDVSPVPHQISLLGFITRREKCRIINLNFSFSLLSPPYVRPYFTWFRIALFLMLWRNSLKHQRTFWMTVNVMTKLRIFWWRVWWEKLLKVYSLKKKQARKARRSPIWNYDSLTHPLTDGGRS